MIDADTLAAPKASRFDFSGFSELVFPRHGDIVYVLCFKSAGMDEFIPFYVGESSRHVGRFGDYVAAHFSASTDFKVGYAARILHERGCEVVVRYKPVTDRRKEEKILIAIYQAAGLKLLNALGSYEYQKAQMLDEIAKVAGFIEQILCQYGASALSVAGTTTMLSVEGPVG